MSEQRLTTQNIRDLVTEWSVTEVGFDRWLASVKAEAWDERDRAEPTYDGPDNGHEYDCLGWEDCYCARYPNPYREEPK